MQQGSLSSAGNAPSASGNSSGSTGSAVIYPAHMSHQIHYQQQQRRYGALFEQTWLKIGNFASLMGDVERAKMCFERALRMNATSISAMLSLASILQDRSQYLQAAELYNRAINCMEAAAVGQGGGGGTPASKGEIWAALGFCALMLDDLPKAYSAYQQALLNLGTVLDPMIWYGIGILYDRYGSDEHALEAYGLAAKLLAKRHNVDPSNTATPYPTASNATSNDSKLIRDVYYRMAVLFRCRRQWDAAVKCFEFVMADPPAGLLPDDLKMQMALVEATRGTADSIHAAKETLLGLIAASAAAGNRPQRLAMAQCHLAWLNSRQGEEEAALSILNQTATADPSNPLPHYYAGRLYSRLKQANRAYEAYQQAVYRDGRNAAYWNSVGILYMESGQFRDALDAFSRAIQLAPYKADCWWNVGCLYESANGQLPDAVDAYQRALELEPTCERIKERLRFVRSILSSANISAAAAADSSSMHRPEPVEVDPLMFLPRPTLLNGQTLPMQHAISSLPPPPSLPKPTTPAGSGGSMPRIPPSVKLSMRT